VEGILGTASLTVSWLFTWLAWRQYRQRHGLHQVVWAAGLALFSLGVTLEVVARWQGAWSEGAYRLWYYVGAMQGVTFLGQGTLHLLDRRPWTRRTLELLVIAAIVSGIVVLNAPVDLTRLPEPAAPVGVAFPAVGEAGFATPRTWTIPFNIYGSIWLIGGAFASTVALWRRQPIRAWGTLLIALAGLGLAGTSTLNRFGITGLETLGRAVGISVLFAGFVLTNSASAARVAVRLPRPPAVIIFAGLGWVLAGVLFFLAFPGAWDLAIYQPGLILIALVGVAMLAAVIARAQQGSRPSRKH
jgi:hypothetical protein